ncbi:hypothetical protein [Flavobacterium faecale]|uniref:hypothetical protein n=1 Tax=Flavobacterium faecale TaxID=1355330 RepID=UPI003AB0A85E
MKKIYAFTLNLFLLSTVVFSQNSSSKITIHDQDLVLTNSIGFSINGTYLYDGLAEPIVLLNSNGTGIFQTKDLSKKNIHWGIEATTDGNPKFEEGFNSAAYTLWYKDDLDSDEKWTSVQLSIHYDKKKIFIAGERSKEYSGEAK